MTVDKVRFDSLNKLHSNKSVEIIYFALLIIAFVFVFFHCVHSTIPVIPAGCLTDFVPSGALFFFVTNYFKIGFFSTPTVPDCHVNVEIFKFKN